jgi:hypothetical protein
VYGIEQLLDRGGSSDLDVPGRQVGALLPQPCIYAESRRAHTGHIHSIANRRRHAGCGTAQRLPPPRPTRRSAGASGRIRPPPG